MKETHLPVGILGVGSSGELDGLVAAGKLDVEPGEEGVNVVISGGLDGKVGLEGQVLLLDGGDVDVLDLAGLGDDRLEIDGVDEGLSESDLLDAAVVETVDVVPEVDLLLLVLLVLDGGNVHGSSVGEDETSGDLSREFDVNEQYHRCSVAEERTRYLSRARRTVSSMLSYRRK